MEGNFISIGRFENGEVKENKKNGQKGLYATKCFINGDVIVNFDPSKIVDVPNYLTVQINEHKHIHLSPDYLQYINHSCDPNVIFNTTNMKLECIKDISIGEEFSFFYPSTEWKVAQSFACNCGSINCIGKVEGAADTSTEILNRYKLTDFITRMLSTNRFR